MISSLFCYTMDIKMKNKSVNAFYTAEILALVVALIFFAAGMPKVVGYACKKNHTTGTVTYQSSRQSSIMSRYIAEMMSEIINHVMGKASGQLIRCCRLRQIRLSMVPMCSGMREIAALWAVRMFI